MKKQILISSIFLIVLLLGFTTITATDTNTTISTSIKKQTIDTTPPQVTYNKEKLTTNDNKEIESDIKDISTTHKEFKAIKDTSKKDISTTKQDTIKEVKTNNIQTKNTTTQNTKNIKTTSKSLKQEDAGTFTELKTIIKDTVASTTLTLTKNYTRGSTESTITIDKIITIDGQGYTLNANGQAGIFKITSGNVILNNITITNSNGSSAITIENGANVTENNINATNNTAQNGGVNYNQGNLTINNGTYTNNTATRYGGVNYNTNGNLTITSGNYTNNKATGSGGINYNQGNLIITNGTYTNNTAGSGGININNGNLTITNGTFTNNKATGSGGINANNRGNLTINNGIYTNNTARNGGINYNIYGNITINNGTYHNNKATSSGGININQGNLTINNGTYHNNTAFSGGVNFNNYSNITINNGTYTNNKATSIGGVNYIFNSNLTINNGTYTNNTANYGGINYNFNSNLTINNGTYNNNNATNGGVNFNNYGNIAINNGTYTNNTATGSGGINYNQGNLTITDGNYTNNKATSLGGVNFNNGTLTIINGIYTNNTGKFTIYSNNNFTVENCLFINNICDNTLFNENLDSSYIKSITNNTYIGNNLTTTITITPTTITSKDELTITITVKPHDIYNTTITTGNITIYEGNEKIKIAPVTDGTILIPYTPHIGEYTLTVTYTDLTISYRTTNKTILLNIPKTTTKLEVTILNNTVTNNTKKVIVTDTQNNKVTTGNITIKDADNNIVGNGVVGTDGIATITTTINTKGSYTLIVTYEENENYTSSSTTLENIEIVGKKSQIDITVTDDIFNETKVKVKVTDPETKETLPNADVEIKLPNGNTVTDKTGENGTIEIPINLPVGEQKITVTYLGNNTYNATNKTQQIKVNKLQTFIILDNITTRINDTTNIMIKVTDKKGNNVNGGRIILKLNGKTLRDSEGNIISAIIENGVATITTTFNQKVGLYQITAVYGGDIYYEPSRNADTILTVTPRDAQLTIEDITPAVIGSEVSFTVKVTDNTKLVDGGRIIIKINGKTVRDSNGNIVYTTVTNGIANIKFTIPDTYKAKTYTLTAVYGDKSYHRAENTTQIEITNPIKTIKNIDTSI